MVSGRNSTLQVRLEGDVDQFNRSMRGAAHELDAFYRSTGTASRSIVGSFSAMQLGITATVGTLTGAAFAVREFVQSASNMAEAQSKLGVVFGESAQDLLAWSETSAQAMGISQRAAIEATGTLGNLFTALGVTRDNAATMSPAIVQLAADLASFNDASPEEALLALRSGLTGEVEPLRRFGVAINAAAVESAALELGLAKTKDEITESIKVQARYALIMDQTTAAQGDFARTSEGLANQQRTLAAEVDNLKVQLGESLLPAVLEVTRELNNLLDENGEQWASDFADAVDLLGFVIGGVADKIGDLNEMIGRLTGSGVFDFIRSGVEGALPGLQLLGIAADKVGNAYDRAQLAKTEGGRGSGMTDAEVDPYGWTPPATPVGPRLGQSGLGGSKAAGPKAPVPTAFSAASLGLIEQLTTGLPDFMGGMDEAGLAEFRAAEAEFKAIRAGVNRDLAALGLSMADLDARGLELTDEFKAQQERADALKDALNRIDLTEDLRLTPWKDAIDAVSESIEKNLAAQKQMADSLFEMSKQFLNVRIAPGAQQGLMDFFGQAGGRPSFGANGEFGFGVDVVVP